STLLRDRSVASFAMDSGEWRWCELEQLLPPHVLLRLAAIKCPLPCFDNAKVRWSRANDLHFTVKSAYLILNVELADRLAKLINRDNFDVSHFLDPPAQVVVLLKEDVITAKL
ncbi:hypothetical protein V6N11_034326, partial [Hibiscus sabdariffa]